MLMPNPYPMLFYSTHWSPELIYKDALDDVFYCTEQGYADTRGTARDVKVSVQEQSTYAIKDPNKKLNSDVVLSYLNYYHTA